MIGLNDKNIDLCLENSAVSREMKNLLRLLWGIFKEEKLKHEEDYS